MEGQPIIARPGGNPSETECSICGITPVILTSLSARMPISPGAARTPSELDLNALLQTLSDLGHVAAQDEEYVAAIEEQLNVKETTQRAAEREALVHKKELQRLRGERDRLTELVRRQKAQIIELKVLEAAQDERTKAALKAKDRVAAKKHVLKSLRAVLRAKMRLLELRRCEKALQILHLMDVRPQEPAPHSRRRLTGCSSIMGIPLPNNGRFEKCPVDAVLIAMRHLAHLVDALSAALCVSLPHPLQPFDLNGPLVSPQFALDTVHSLLPVTILSNRDRIREFCWDTLEDVLLQCEKANKSGEPCDAVPNPTFQQQALVLLQADVVALCLHAGLSAEVLYPPQAMLLNLSLLGQHAQRRCEALQAALDEDQPSVRVLDSSEILDETQRRDQEALVDPAVLAGVETELSRRYEPRQQSRFERPPASSIALDAEEWTFV